MRTVHALRYITPLREGGSLPAVVETDDDGMAVLKFRGAGQGPKALIAELIAGEMARTLQLPLPEIVFVTAFDHFAVKAFAASVVDYLLKPVTGSMLADEKIGPTSENR